MAVRWGLEVLAITDHDSTEGIEQALEAARHTQLEVIPGVEISTDVPRSEVHILGYYVDYNNTHLQEALFLLRNGRVGRAQKMVTKLTGLGMPLEWERVQELAGVGAIGRPHIARALLEKGYISTMAEAFELYIGRNGPAYAERYKLSPEQAVELITQAGGLPGLAHPVIIRPANELGEQLDLDELVPRLVKVGLVAIEAYYLDYPPKTTQQLIRLAHRYGLIATGGSDFHGHGIFTRLGEVFVPPDAVTQLKTLANSSS
jgi:predicted metal-dependent phosphoesterase TrpH